MMILHNIHTYLHMQYLCIDRCIDCVCVSAYMYRIRKKQRILMNQSLEVGQIEVFFFSEDPLLDCCDFSTGKCRGVDQDPPDLSAKSRSGKSMDSHGV